MAVYFVALLPYPRQIPPSRVLALMQRHCEGVAKYSLEEISEAADGSSATAHLVLAYRKDVENDINNRAPLRLSAKSVTRVLDFMFGRRFIATLDSAGKLRIQPHIPSEWSLEEKELAENELGVHFYHFAKFCVQRLQQDGHLPRDFEFKRHLARLSLTPEMDLISRFEEVTASAREAMIGSSIGLFQRTEDALRTKKGKFAYSFRLFEAARLKRHHWVRGSREVNTTRSIVHWLRWLAWHGLVQQRHEVESRIGGRVDAACCDFAHIEREHDAFVEQQAALAGETGLLLGIIGLAIAGVSIGNSFGWHPAALVTIAGVAFIWAARSIITTWQTLTMLQIQAVTIRELYRSEPPTV